MRGSRLLMLSLIVCIAPMGIAHATDYSIILSNSCLTMLKNNVSTICPSYEEILTLFPDTSNKEISGGFIYKDNILQREQTHFKTHFEYYRYDKSDRIWVDPPGDTILKTKRIYIQPTDFVYKITQQKITNNTLLVGQGRYVSSTCTEIVITAVNWIFLLGDSMQLIKHNCDPKFTNFNEVKIRTWEKTKHDITTSYKYQLDKWIKETKMKCKEKCFEY